MSYAVKEIYYTLQGEGAQAGRAAVFLRFSGCNLWSGHERDRLTADCRFCDTDFVGTDGPGPPAARPGRGLGLARAQDIAGKVTAAQMDRWAGDFDNWGICDTVCFVLFDRTPHAWAKVEAWSGRPEEYVRRAAFALLAAPALVPALVLAFAYTTLVPGLAATVVWFWLVNRIGATRAATFHFLNPFFGVAVAAAFLGETLGLPAPVEYLPARLAPFQQPPQLGSA